jgi:CBS domain containing-hemolysin-like protein
MSGLQQAVMQVNPAELANMRRHGGESERKVATLLAPLVKRRHLTLVCLLIGNAMAMEALPVFMDFLMPKFAAIMLSVTAVVFFSEIIPQAMCLRWPLELAGLFSWLMYLLVAVLYPVAAPIAWILDYLFGEEHESLLSKGGLRELVINHARIHGNEQHSVLTSDEVGIMVGVLDLHKQKVGNTMTKLSNVQMLSEDQRLDDTTLTMLSRDGHSRVPIHASGDSSHVIGLLLVKHLVRIDRNIRVQDLDTILPILVVDESVSLFSLLRRFCRGESHMAVVVKESESVVGGGGGFPISQSNNNSSAVPSPIVSGISKIKTGSLKTKSETPTPSIVAATSTSHPHNTNNNTTTMRIGGGGGDDVMNEQQQDQGIRLCDPFLPETHAHGVVGVVTLEDVLEKLLRIDIKDEKDLWKPAQDDIETRLAKLEGLGKMLIKKAGPSSTKNESTILSSGIYNNNNNNNVTYGTML